MKTHDKFEHPEVSEFMHICAVSPDDEGTREACELLKKNTETLSKNKKKRIKKEKELDRNLGDTFPASDPVTRY